ncbi:KAP family P-loop NTPase fold protein [Vitreoscilla sp. C1]|uniref:KAP family P-loop NTPase fold protein n=1 Tax=Vitreoscilla sp. (strain C1) TaxID=96942 RepID=UPI00148EB763|nr:P-loop NTPase fold protein [Vitreoscilla sp. C1]
MNLQKDADYENIVTPFGDDLLGRETLAKHLTGYIDRLKIGAVLAIDAPWGEGKTYFVRHWKKYLEKEDNPHNVIYLNAFAQDYLDDPFMVLAAEISHAFEQVDSSNELVKTFKKQTIDAAKALLPEMPKLLFSLGMFLTGAGYLGKNVQDALTAAQDVIHDDAKEAMEGMGEALQEKLQDAIKERLENHETEKQTLVSFKQSLQKLAADNDLNPKPLVFIIDELDRCNPLFSVRLIERIKHFFDIPNIVFVLVTDKTQLQATICHQFGYNEAAGEAYLDKFVDFSIKLERPKNVDRKDEYLKIISTILTELGFSENEMTHYKYLALIFATVHNKSIRQITKTLNRFSLLHINHNISRNYVLLYKLFNPRIDNQTPLFVHIFYEFTQYFDNNVQHENGSSIEAYIKTSLADRDEHGQFRWLNPILTVSLNISEDMSNEVLSFFESLSLVTEKYIEASTFRRGNWEYIPYNQFCLKTTKDPFDINKDWDEYIKTGLNE